MEEEVFLAAGTRVLGRFGKLLLGTMWPELLELVLFIHSTRPLPS